MYCINQNSEHFVQGDIISREGYKNIRDFEKRNLPKFEPEEYFKGILILTYTCDLIHARVEFINFCPIFAMDLIINEFTKGFIEKFKEKQDILNAVKNAVRNKFEQICKNEIKNIFYLNSDDIFDNIHCYANLEQIYSLPLEDARDLLLKRIASLNNPWIEKLGFKIGYCFNRIAIPEITKTEIKELFENKYQYQIEDIFKKTNELISEL